MTLTLQKSVTVPLSADAAFDLFARDMARWWPAKHSQSGKPVRIEVEPHKGGQITEIAPDGTRILWGTIIGWEPGKHVSFTWHPGEDTDKDKDKATIIAIAFTQTPDGTRVDLTQGGFEVLGDLADAVSTTYLRGWALVLGCYYRFAANALVDA